MIAEALAWIGCIAGVLGLIASVRGNVLQWHKRKVIDARLVGQLHTLNGLRNKLKVLEIHCAETVNIGEILRTEVQKSFARDIAHVLVIFQQDVTAIIRSISGETFVDPAAKQGDDSVPKQPSTGKKSDEPS